MTAPHHDPMVISRAGYAALMRVLLEQDDLRVTDIDSQPVAVGGPSENRFYRVRLTAVGEEGEARMNVLLKVFPEPTWMETWNERLDGPTEVVALESDLLSSLPEGVIDPTIASARAREGKPAWTMASDVIADLGQAGGIDGMDSGELRLVLLRLAEWHALHWEAREVLDFVYPWLTRQAEWLTASADVYARALRNVAAADPAADRLAAAYPQAGVALRGLFAALSPEDRDTLTQLLNAPAALVERLAAVPVTVIHGAPTVDHMAVNDGQLVLVEWETLQVGPSSWDMWTFLTSLPESTLSTAEALDFYLQALEGIVGPVDRVAWQAAYRLTPVAAFVLWDLGQAARATPHNGPSPGLVARATEAARLSRTLGLA